MKRPNLDALLSADQLALLLSVAESTVKNWASRYPERMPKRGRLGRRSLYRYGDAVEVERETRASPYNRTRS